MVGFKVEMECGEVGNMLICWEIWRGGIGLLKVCQCSRWIENNSLRIKVFILHTIVDSKNI